jgi:putative MATE family efflux protein
MGCDMTTDMTKGSITRHLIYFVIPLILANFLTLTYNAVDSIILGRFIGRTALASVGTSNPLMTFALLFTNGICLGTSILVGHHYGAGNLVELQKQTATGLLTGGVISLFIGLVMAALAPQILTVLQVPGELLPEASSYLRIIMSGLIFSFSYSYFASILRALGDSRSPLFILAVSAALNIAGDLVFVVLLKWGTEGAAISTVLCEALSAACTCAYMFRYIPELRIRREWFVFDRGLIKKTLSYSMVSAVQQSALQIGKLGTQAIVNTMGITVTAAYNVTNRFDDYAMVPLATISHAMTTFMAQNDGAHETRRVLQGFKIGIVISFLYALVFGVFVYACSNLIMQLFTPDAEIIAEGEKYLLRMCWIYLLCSVTNTMQGFFRGLGQLRITLWSSLININTRVISCAILAFGFGFAFLSVPYSMLIGWILMTLFELPLVHRYLTKLQFPHSS